MCVRFVSNLLQRITHVRQQTAAMFACSLDRTNEGSRVPAQKPTFSKLTDYYAEVQNIHCNRITKTHTISFSKPATNESEGTPPPIGKGLLQRLVPCSNTLCLCVTYRDLQCCWLHHLLYHWLLCWDSSHLFLQSRMYRSRFLLQ